MPSEQKYQTVAGKHKPIVKIKLFEAVQKKLKQNSRITSNHIEHGHIFLLKDLFYCDECGLPMKTTWAKGHGGIYYYYRCICKENYIRADVIEEQIISKVRNYCFGSYCHEIAINEHITPGLIGKDKIIQFVRRLTLAKGTYRKKILQKIIKKISFNNAILNLDLK